ncbi:MAG: nuclear transport factor 2 family protein [Rhodospirillaceae bacterium]|nr:nuclear transport factor 2 family protein [Rhodospirillaceae bacterium]
MRAVQREAVLFANEAFYDAFVRGDIAAMDEVWAEGVPVACAHPGWAPLTDREAVMSSWRGIFGSHAAPAILFSDARAFVYGDFAFVLCYERIGPNVLVATNVFLRQGDAWKMVHHQAGLTSARPSAADTKPAGQVH